MMKLIQILSATFVLVLLSAGCVHREIVQERPVKGQTTLFVARAGDSVELSWKTEKDATYMLLCSEDLGGSGHWRPVPGAETLRGTGEKISFRDTVPTSEKRYYRLQIMRGAAAP